MDAQDPAAVARFDRHRGGRKTSNKEWVNPADPDAKAGRIKDEACDTIYKPEPIVDLESGAIVAAAVRPGDAGDMEDLSGRVLDAVELVEKIHGQKHLEGASHVKDLTGDKGFHSPRELGIIQEAAGLRTIIGDPNADRRQPTKPRARSPAGRGQCRPCREKQKRQSPAQKTRRTT